MYNLVFPYEANQKCEIQSEDPKWTFYGKKPLDKTFLQGDTWGPTMAANQVDGFGKHLLKEDPDYIYKYKGYVPI